MSSGGQTMRRVGVLLALLVLLSLTLYFSVTYLFLKQFSAPAPAAAMEFRPPTPDGAPPSLRPAVLLGYDIMMDTGSFARPYVGNQLTCSNCHFGGGLIKEGIPLVGVAATYPKFRSRTNYATDLVERTNECFERSMNGRALPVDSKEMQALQAYFAWISRDVPIYSNVPWLGVKRVPPTRPPDRVAGQTIYAARCANCHARDGQGTAQAPPLWGPQSFNDGAGIKKLPLFASFVYANMPRGQPDLSIDEAYDVASYVTAQPRPHYENAKPLPNQH